MRLKEPKLYIEIEDDKLLILNVLDISHLSVSSQYSAVGILELSEVTLKLVVDQASIESIGEDGSNEYSVTRKLKGRQLMLLGGEEDD